MWLIFQATGYQCCLHCPRSSGKIVWASYHRMGHLYLSISTCSSAQGAFFCKADYGSPESKLATAYPSQLLGEVSTSFLSLGFLLSSQPWDESICYAENLANLNSSFRMQIEIGLIMNNLLHLVKCKPSNSIFLSSFWSLLLSWLDETVSEISAPPIFMLPKSFPWQPNVQFHLVQWTLPECLAPAGVWRNKWQDPWPWGCHRQKRSEVPKDTTPCANRHISERW